MPEKPAKRSYTQEEVDAILSRALSKQAKDESKYAHDDLVAAAMEVGISREAIEHAAEEQGENESDEEESPSGKPASIELTEDDALVARWRERSHAGFVRHFGSYAIISAMLFLIARFTHSGHWYFWPMLGWGVAIAFHALGYFGASREKMIEEERRRISRASRREARREARDERDRARHDRKVARAKRKEQWKKVGTFVEAEIDRAAGDLLKVLEKRRIANVRVETETAKEKMRARVAELDRQREELDPSFEEAEEQAEKKRKSR